MKVIFYPTISQELYTKRLSYVGDNRELLSDRYFHMYYNTSIINSFDSKILCSFNNSSIENYEYLLDIEINPYLAWSKTHNIYQTTPIVFPIAPIGFQSALDDSREIQKHISKLGIKECMLSLHGFSPDDSLMWINGFKKFKHVGWNVYGIYNRVDHLLNRIEIILESDNISKLKYIHFDDIYDVASIFILVAFQNLLIKSGYKIQISFNSEFSAKLASQLVHINGFNFSELDYNYVDLSMNDTVAFSKIKFMFNQEIPCKITEQNNDIFLLENNIMSIENILRYFDKIITSDIKYIQFIHRLLYSYYTSLSDLF